MIPNVRKKSSNKSDSYIYVFHHIPKCGGTSLYNAFNQWFKCKRDYRPPWAEGRRLEKFRSRPINLKKLKHGDMICGHYEIEGIYLSQRYPGIVKNPRFRIITFVRHPLSLRLSLLKHEIRHHRITGKEPIESLLFDRPNWISERFPLCDSNLHEILDNYFYIGIFEQLQLSFDFLADILHKPKIILSQKNRSKPRKFPITEEMKQKFQEVHQLDYRLYQYCLDRSNKK